MASLDIETALPRVVAKDAPLAFHRFRPGNALLEGRMRVLEPSPAAPQVVPAIVVVPLVAFDAEGYRLGYGGGFYDRTLAGLGPDHLALGLAIEVQRASPLPRDTTDVRLETIVTETGVHHFPL
jgi:5-formyltetrahydrofolate cyclo-ligase